MQNFYIDKGTDFAVILEIKDELDLPVDVSGDNFSSEIVGLPTVQFTILKFASGLSLGLTKEQTADVEPGRYIYTIRRTSGVSTTTFLNGTIVIG